MAFLNPPASDDLIEQGKSNLLEKWLLEKYLRKKPVNHFQNEEDFHNKVNLVWNFYISLNGEGIDKMLSLLGEMERKNWIYIKANFVNVKRIYIHDLIYYDDVFDMILKYLSDNIFPSRTISIHSSFGEEYLDGEMGSIFNSILGNFSYIEWTHHDRSKEYLTEKKES